MNISFSKCIIIVTVCLWLSNQMIAQGEDVYLINRGHRTSELPQGAHSIVCDINDEETVKAKLAGMKFDAVCDFIGFVPEQVERDHRLFKGITKQYIYISSASAYGKPVRDYRITEGTALANPYWQYARNKIDCENLLMKYYREEGFPVTIVRPSYTYDERSVPLGVMGRKGSFQVIKRMMEGKPVIIQGDGTSLWTMTFNTDFAMGFCGLIGNPKAIGEAFQITSDETLTWNQIYEIIANILDVELKAVHVSSEFLAEAGDFNLEGSLLGDKACSVVFDNSKLKAAVPEFRPVVHFEQGIRKTLEHILATPELQVEDPEFDAWCDKVISVLEDAKKIIRG